jgi:hypothetical protein
MEAQQLQHDEQTASSLISAYRNAMRQYPVASRTALLAECDAIFNHSRAFSTQGDVVCCSALSLSAEKRPDGEHPCVSCSHAAWRACGTVTVAHSTPVCSTAIPRLARQEEAERIVVLSQLWPRTSTACRGKTLCLPASATGAVCALHFLRHRLSLSDCADTHGSGEGGNGSRTTCTAPCSRRWLRRVSSSVLCRC